MNWKCIVCDDDYGKDPKPAKNLGYGTLNNGQDVGFICPVHLDMVEEKVAELRRDHQATRPALTASSAAPTVYTAGVDPGDTFNVADAKFPVGAY